MESNHLCECGCGKYTNIVQKTYKKIGHIKGKPFKYCAGHRSKKSNHRKVTGNQRIYRDILQNDYGVELKIPMVVHHIDGNINNNFLYNLKIFPSQSEHNKYHQDQIAKLACGHANWRKCKYCHKYDDIGSMKRDGRAVFHQDCAKKFRRDRTKQLREKQCQIVLSV